MKKKRSKFIKLLFLMLFTVSISADYKLGVDYRIVDNPLPVKKDGIVEVTETFWYGCGACYQFDPSVNSWASKQTMMLNLQKCQLHGGTFISYMLLFTIL